MNLVDRFGVVLRLQRIAGTSVTHRPIYLLSRSKMRGLSPWRTNVESVKDAWLKSLEDHAIGTLDLTISTWMSDRGPVDPDVISITEVQELLPGEVSSVVGDDTVRNTETVDDVKEEVDCLFRANVGDGLHLYPLGEFVHHYE